MHKKLASEPEFIGEGSYGCVVKPTVACSNPTYKLGKGKRKTKTNSVSKIFTHKSDFMKELDRTRIAIDVDPSGKTLLLPTKACNASYKNIKNNTASQQCENLQDDFSSLATHGTHPTAYQFHMPYGGIRFDKYVKSQHKYGNPVTPFKLLTMMKSMFKGLQMLEKKQICHQDIKSGNVLYTPKGETVIIDFSLMMPYKDIYVATNSSRWKYSYYPYPPEYKIYHYQHRLYEYNKYNNEYEQNNYDDITICRKAFENIQSWGSTAEAAYAAFYSADEFNALAKQTLDYYKSAKSAIALEKRASVYCEKIDLYSVGMLMVLMFEYVDNTNQKHRSLLKEFIKALVNPNVVQRPTVKVATANYKALLKQLT